MGSKPDNILSTLPRKDSAESTRNKMFYRFCMIISEGIFFKKKKTGDLRTWGNLLDDSSTLVGVRVPKRCRA